MADLQQALEDYLPFLLGLVKDGKQQAVQMPLQLCLQVVLIVTSLFCRKSVTAQGTVCLG